MLITGRCHCGNISFALDWQPEPTDIPARACSCSFCTKHGGVWTSRCSNVIYTSHHHCAALACSSHPWGQHAAHLSVGRRWPTQRGALCRPGVTSVAFTWSVLAVLGVGTIFIVYPDLRHALQLAGALYLLYVAVRLWRAGEGVAASSGQHVGALAGFRMGFLTNIMNPKSALFFGSVFATVLPEAPSGAMMVAAVCVSVTNTFTWHMFLAIAFSHSRVQAAYARQSRRLSRLAGVLVGGFGLHLLVATVTRFGLAESIRRNAPQLYFECTRSRRRYCCGAPLGKTLNAMSDVAPFYDSLAPYYHLLYGDWEASVARQGAALASLLDSHGVRRGEAILDAACGIGTQTLGLLTNGYSVTASDCSPAAVGRLRSDLLKRGLSCNTYVDDLRSLRHSPSAAFSAVVACDNSIPHLLTDAELLECFQNCLRCLRPGGLGIFSVRDYAAIPRINPDVRPYAIRNVDGVRFLAVQVWEWDGDHYDLRMYLTLDRNGNCDTQVLNTRYYAVTIDKLLTLMQEAGFVATQRIDGVLFQPVLLGQRPDTV